MMMKVQKVRNPSNPGEGRLIRNGAMYNRSELKKDKK
jgi:hypothetical protein